MTPEEKKAYNRQYYLEYRKKGQKKGRKKGSKKKTSAKKGKQTSLTGLSTAGLNDAGKMQWAMAKENLTKEMNTALSKAKTDEEKAKIRSEYQNKALAELQKIKSDPKTAQAKKSEKKSKGSSSKGSGSKSSGSKGKSKENSSKSTDDDDDDDIKTSSKAASTVKVPSSSKGSTGKIAASAPGTMKAPENVEQQRELMNRANEVIESLKDKLSEMTDEEKEHAKEKISTLIEELRKRM